MSSLFASIVKNGVRETFRMWSQGEIAIHERPPTTHSRYVRIRRKTKQERKRQSAVYQLSSKVEGDRGVVKTYQRVNDGQPPDDKEVDELVIARKKVSNDQRQRQRMIRREREEMKALSSEQATTGSSQEDNSIHERHSAGRESPLDQARKSGNRSHRNPSSTKAVHDKTVSISWMKSTSHRKKQTSISESQGKSIQWRAPSSKNHRRKSFGSREITVHSTHTQSVNVSNRGPATHHNTRPKNKPSIHSKSEQAGSTIRQIYSTEVESARRLTQPLHTDPEAAPRRSSTFHQPEMDEQSSRSFVFGSQGHTLAPAVGVVSQPLSTAPINGLVAEDQIAYVRRPDINNYVVDSRNHGLELIPEEEPAHSQRVTMTSGAGTSPKTSING